MSVIKNKIKNNLDMITSAFINELHNKFDICRTELINTWNEVNNSYKKYNIGELDEIKLVNNLFKMNEEKKYDMLSNCLNYEASDGIEIINVTNQNKYNFENEINKTPSSYKADVGIRMKKTNNIYYASIKSKSGANYAILNHTHRMAKVFQIGDLNRHLHNIDILINEYITKRSENIINEDVKLLQLESLQNINVKNSIIEVLRYFIFTGTGKGNSKQPANSILIYNNGNIDFKIYNTEFEQRQYVSNILSNCIISLRSKGMPKNVNENHKPWIFNDINNKQKGCLHIRVCNA